MDEDDYEGGESSSRDDLGKDFEKGMMSMQNKEYEHAVNHFSRSLESNPQDEDIAYNLACCFSIIKDVNQGLLWLQKSIEWGLSEGNPDNDSDLSFLKRKAKAQFSELVNRFRDPTKATEGAKLVLPLVVEKAGTADRTNRPSRTATQSGRQKELVGEEVTPNHCEGMCSW
jgi:hypothetical protein